MLMVSNNAKMVGYNQKLDGRVLSLCLELVGQLCLPAKQVADV